MNVERPNYSADQNGYFGITLLGVDIPTATLTANTLKNVANRETHIHFDEVTASYDEDREALTLEGVAASLSSPGFAIHSMYSYVKTAHDISHAA
jgi:hypothetical protein